MKMFDADKTRMIGLPYGEKNCDDMLSRFHLIPERNRRTDRQTDRQTDRFSTSTSISRVSMLTRDKKYRFWALYCVFGGLWVDVTIGTPTVIFAVLTVF